MVISIVLECRVFIASVRYSCYGVVFMISGCNTPMQMRHNMTEMQADANQRQKSNKTQRAESMLAFKVDGKIIRSPYKRLDGLEVVKSWMRVMLYNDCASGEIYVPSEGECEGKDITETPGHEGKEIGIMESKLSIGFTITNVSFASQRSIT